MADITVPPEAVEAAARTLYFVRCKITAVASGARLSDFEPWGGVAATDQDDYRYEARAAILAALNAWPGIDTIMLPRMTKPGHFVPQRYIRLPLPQDEPEDPSDVAKRKWRDVPVIEEEPGNGE